MRLMPFTRLPHFNYIRLQFSRLECHIGAIRRLKQTPPSYRGRMLTDAALAA
jgi:hypothetical protein